MNLAHEQPLLVSSRTPNFPLISERVWAQLWLLKITNFVEVSVFWQVGLFVDRNKSIRVFWRLNVYIYQESDPVYRIWP